MSYTNGLGLSSSLIATVPFNEAEDASAAIAIYGYMAACENVEVDRFYFYVSKACVASVTAPVVALKLYDKPGGTAISTLATITVPTGTAIGKVLYKDFSATTVAPGQALCFQHTVQAVNASAAACSGYYAVKFNSDPEFAKDCSNLVLSA